MLRLVNLTRALTEQRKFNKRINTNLNYDHNINCDENYDENDNDWKQSLSSNRRVALEEEEEEEEPELALWRASIGIILHNFASICMWLAGGRCAIMRRGITATAPITFSEIKIKNKKNEIMNLRKGNEWNGIDLEEMINS